MAFFILIAMQNVFYREYLFRVWTITVLVGPLLLCLYLQLIENNWSGFRDFVVVLFLMVLFTAALSAPTFLMLILLFSIFKKIFPKVILIKILTASVAIAGCLLSFYILQFNLYPFAGPVIYALVLLCSSFMLSPKHGNA